MLAERLAGILGPDALAPAARAVVAGEAAGRPIGVACSGGADSVALLLLLWACFPERRGRWLVLHFDHRLRGRASTADARFVARVASALGERAAIGRWTDRPADAAAVSEASARQARQRFFEAALAGAGGRVLALGHQADDVAETMLMRMSRGSGTEGLCAPRPVHPSRQPGGLVRIRPLLDLPGRVIRKALVAAGAPWREDASNFSEVHQRNRVRRKVIPALVEACGERTLEGVLLSRRLLEEDSEALDAWLEQLLPGWPGEPGSSAGITALVGKPRGLVRRALWRWLGKAGLFESLSRPAVEQLVDAVRLGRSLALSAGADRRVCCAGGCLVLETGRRDGPAGEPPEPGTLWAWNAEAASWVGPDQHMVHLQTRRLTARLREWILAGKPRPDREAFVDAARVDRGRLLVRTRRPGDRFRPLGAGGQRKLKDAFIDAKIPVGRRAWLPVVCCGDTVVWVPGFPPAQPFAINENTNTVLQLTYE